MLSTPSDARADFRTGIEKIEPLVAEAKGIFSVTCERQGFKDLDTSILSVEWDEKINMAKIEKITVPILHRNCWQQPM